MKKPLLAVGESAVIHYPDTTHVRFIDGAIYKPRRLIVREIRDLYCHPLTVEEFLRRPFILRSRWLIRALDVDSRDHRQFYLGTSREFRAPTELRMAIYDPGEHRPAEWVGRPFAATPADRRLMMQAAKEWSQYDYGSGQLRVTAYDLRVIRRPRYCQPAAIRYHAA